jgi:hypothetical protein
MSKGGFASGFAFGYDPTGRSGLFKIDRIHYFDPPSAEYSLFDIRFFRVSFSIKLAAFLVGGWADT